MTKPRFEAMPSYWSCRKCAHRNERTASRKCQGCGELTKPKRRVPKHAETLRDLTREQFADVNEAIHGTRDDCGCCGSPLLEDGQAQREHDHRTGLPRGLTCFRCNHLLLRNHTLDSARMMVAYFERVESHYARERIEA